MKGNKKKAIITLSICGILGPVLVILDDYRLAKKIHQKSFNGEVFRKEITETADYVLYLSDGTELSVFGLNDQPFSKYKKGDTLVKSPNSFKVFYKPKSGEKDTFYSFWHDSYISKLFFKQE